ncbi:MAG: metallophosphoesterase [Halomonadaceae bacterium]|nr:MAG: metallophosphoesterase [Halomonadaceae bacterium]
MHGALEHTREARDNQRLYQLQLRLGAAYSRQRLGLEAEKQATVLRGRGKHVHLENLYSLPSLIRFCLRCVGLYGRAMRNSRKLLLNQNRFVLPHLPAAFEGFRILHLSDLHIDMDEANLDALISRVQGLDYDLCVLTGDFRRDTWGDIEPALAGMARLRPHLKGRALAVLGNHDSITMVPDLEAMGYEMLMNEHCTIERGEDTFWVAGVDDAHYYRVDNIERAMEGIPVGVCSLLLSHTPEIFRQGAHGGFDLFMCGHTHGGQLCLPGGIPITLDARMPRRLGRGAWRHGEMQGYTSTGSGTSVLNVRLNCPPEVTLHTLTQGPYAPAEKA